MSFAFTGVYWLLVVSAFATGSGPRRLPPGLPLECENLLVHDEQFSYKDATTPLMELAWEMRGEIHPALIKSEGNYHTAVDEYIRAGEKTDARDAAGRTPLMHAIAARNPLLFDALVDYGADLTAKDSYGRSVLDFVELYKVDSLGKIRYLKNELESKRNLYKGSYITFYMARLLKGAGLQANQERLERLFAEGVSPDSRFFGSSDTLLMRAAAEGNLPAVHFLIKHGADPQASGENGTPLTIAISSRKMAVTEALISKYKVDVNKSSEGELPRHPLIEAVRVGSDSLLRFLLDNGLDVRYIHPRFGTALHVIAEGLGKDIESERMLRLLVSKEPSLLHMETSKDGSKRKKGETPLHVAAGFAPSPRAIEILVRLGANVNARDAQGATPLMRAVIKGNPEHAAALIAAQANRELRARNGQTALDLARLLEDRKVRARMLSVLIKKDPPPPSSSSKKKSLLN